MLHGPAHRGSLHEIIDARALLLLRLVVERDKRQLALEPLVVAIRVAEEDLARASLADAAHLQLATHVNRHLVDDGALSLGEAQGIYNVSLRYNLL